MIRIAVEEDVYVQARKEGDEGWPVVFLIPDWMGSSLYFRELVPTLLARRLAVIVWDPRGTGRSDRPASGYTMDRQVDDALAVLAALWPERTFLVGEGYGALVAAEMAGRRPEQIQGIVLSAPTVPGSVQVPDLDRAVEDWRVAMDVVASHAAVTLDPHLLAQTAQDMGHTSREAALGQLAVMKGLDVTRPAGRALDGLRVGAVVGDYDTFSRRDALRAWLQAVCPEVRLEVAPNVGHYVSLEAPGIVARMLQAWCMADSPDGLLPAEARSAGDSAPEPGPAPVRPLDAEGAGQVSPSVAAEVDGASRAAPVWGPPPVDAREGAAADGRPAGP